MIGKYLFLSYSSKEIQFALKLAQDIRQQGILLWMDKLDGIRMGDDWVKALEVAVNEAIGLVVVLSPNYVQSQFCRAELSRANSLKIPIFPVLIHPVPPTDVPLMLQTTQYLDFTAWQTPASYDQTLALFIRTLSDKLNIIPQAPIESHIIPDSQSVASARQIEARLDDAKVVISRSTQRRMNFYQSQLEILNEQYDAVMKAFLIENNPATRVLLGKQLTGIDDDIAKIEGELNKLA